MTTIINIAWHQPDERPLGREDSCWYTYQSEHDLVATVSIAGKSIDIYSDGEMRVSIYRDPDKKGEGHDIVRYCEDWHDYGITSDADIFSANENGRIEWIHNSWFDLYATDETVGELGWIDCVCDTLTDAIERATTLLSDSELWGEASDS